MYVPILASISRWQTQYKMVYCLQACMSPLGNKLAAKPRQACMGPVGAHTCLSGLCSYFVYDRTTEATINKHKLVKIYLGCRLVDRCPHSSASDLLT